MARTQKPSKELLSCASESEQEDFIASVGAAMPALRVYMKLIKNRIKKKRDIRNDDYDCPSWSHKQADTNGYIRALEELLKEFPRPEGE